MYIELLLCHPLGGGAKTLYVLTYIVTTYVGSLLLFETLYIDVGYEIFMMFNEITVDA